MKSYRDLTMRYRRYWLCPLHGRCKGCAASDYARRRRLRAARPTAASITERRRRRKAVGEYRCRCPVDEEGRLVDGHDDRCPAGQLQEWAGRRLDALRARRSAVIYTVERLGNGRVSCDRAVVHQVRHSPDGYETGYGGSGPADLALSILADFYGDVEAAWRGHQSFKWRFIAPRKLAVGERYTITGPEIAAWAVEADLTRRGESWTG
jgi:hypothetical protein